MNSSQVRVSQATSSWTKYGRVEWRMEMERQRLSFPWQRQNGGEGVDARGEVATLEGCTG